MARLTVKFYPLAPFYLRRSHAGLWIIVVSSSGKLNPDMRTWEFEVRFELTASFIALVIAGLWGHCPLVLCSGAESALL